MPRPPRPSRRPGRPVRPPAVVLLLALALPAVAACSGGDPGRGGAGGPDPQPVVDALAAGLTSADLGDVPLIGLAPSAAQERYDAVVAGMGGLEPQVSAGEVRVDGATATADLAWTWPLGADDWRYTAPVTLTLEDGAWRAAWSPALVEPSLADDEVLDLTPIAARRGVVRGAGGAVLVTDRPVVRFGIDRSRVSRAAAPASARRLAALLGIDPAAYARRVAAAGPLAFVEGLVLRKDDVPPAVARGYDTIPGSVAIADRIPLAPSRTFAAPLLGSVGPVTAEMVKDHPDTYRPGDVAGLSGLEARYDAQLRGTPGAVVRAVVGTPDSADPSADSTADPSADSSASPSGSGSTGSSPRALFRVAPRGGAPLRISLDERWQDLAERVLANVGPPSALVAVRPSTGAVLAAANGPGGALNLATYGRAAPGSTFKIVSSLALLRAGLRPTSRVTCPPSVVVDGKRFGNYSDYPPSGLGTISLATALANSCNTAFIGQRDRLGEGDLAAAAASLGFGVDHEVGFPAFFGEVARPGSPTEAAADLIGQGGVLASPMAMATVLASVQAGRTVVPWLVQGQQADPPSDAAPLTGAETAALRAMLRGVVVNGSGRGLADVPGAPVLAKTGTAEFESGGRTLTHAWMVAAQGDLAVAVYVERGESGSGTAGPLLERFLRER